MKVFVFLAVMVSCMADDPTPRCDAFASVADFSDVADSGSKWYYADTNHLYEECNTAVYTADDNKSGVWLVKYQNSTVHMTCPMWKIDGSNNIWGLRVRETGSGYQLKVAAYDKNNWFCWLQCDINGLNVDFWHCAMSTDFPNDKAYNAQFWKAKLADTKLPLEPLMKIYQNYNKCTISP